MVTLARATRPTFPWRLFVPAAVVSAVTMPITAIWLAILAPALAVAGSFLALIPRSDATRERWVLGVAAVAGGLFVGPAIYLGLSLL